MTWGLRAVPRHGMPLTPSVCGNTFVARHVTHTAPQHTHLWSLSPLWFSLGWYLQPPPRRTPPAPQGVYVLQDNGFRWLQRLSPPAPGSDPGREEAARQLALSYLHLPCGIVRGALCHLGVICTVEADPKQMPSCECARGAWIWWGQAAVLRCTDG